MPKKKKKVNEAHQPPAEQVSKKTGGVKAREDVGEQYGFATSLNEELTDKIKDNPNKFIGCGG